MQAPEIWISNSRFWIHY